MYITYTYRAEMRDEVNIRLSITPEANGLVTVQLEVEAARGGKALTEYTTFGGLTLERKASDVSIHRTDGAYGNIKRVSTKSHLEAMDVTVERIVEAAKECGERLKWLFDDLRSAVRGRKAVEDYLNEQDLPDQIEAGGLPFRRG